jgi:predicted DNA-binding protein
MTLPIIYIEKNTKVKSFRIPTDLIRKLEEAAKNQSRTANGFLVNLLKETLTNKPKK